MRGSQHVLEKYPECKWTETHAQLLQMGGFQIINEDGTSYRLKDIHQIPSSHLHILKIPER